jgi:hypothetical protein
LGGRKERLKDLTPKRNDKSNCNFPTAKGGK